MQLAGSSRMIRQASSTMNYRVYGREKSMRKTSKKARGFSSSMRLRRNMLHPKLVQSRNKENVNHKDYGRKCAKQSTLQITMSQQKRKPRSKTGRDKKLNNAKKRVKNGSPSCSDELML